MQTDGVQQILNGTTGLENKIAAFQLKEVSLSYYSSIIVLTEKITLS